MTLHQSGDVTVARPAQQIALPMPGNGTIFDFRRSVADGDSIHDPALGVSVNAGVPPFRFPFPIVEFRRYSAVMDANRRVTNAKEDASKPEELALVLARKIDALAQNPGERPTAIPGLTVYRLTAPTACYAEEYETADVPLVSSAELSAADVLRW